MVDIFSKFPQYCESVANFWIQEPLNAITNIAFFVSAFFLYRTIKKERLSQSFGWVLIGLMIILGLGSLAWHSYRSIFTLLADEIPIYIFIIFALYFLVQSLVRRVSKSSIILLIIAISYYLLFAFIPGASIYQGALKYLYAILVFSILNIYVVNQNGSSYSFSSPLIILTGALVLRTIDLEICAFFPIGTHFIWHIAVAWAMYLSSLKILQFYQKNNQRLLF